MVLFEKAKVVRLRSYHDKYLMADEDKESVYLDRDGGSYKNAKWNVEFVEYGTKTIRLRSCFGNYLTATNMPFLLGATGKKVLQTLPSRLNSSLEWEPIREGMQVRLKTRYGQYLRGNGGPPPWRNSVTHDVPHRTATTNWILWDVDILEARQEQQSTTKHRRTQRPDRSTSLNYFHTPFSSSSPSSIHSPLLQHNNNNNNNNGTCVRVSDISSKPGECRDLEEIESPEKEGRSIIFYDVADEIGDSNKEKFFNVHSKEVACVQLQHI